MTNQEYLKWELMLKKIARKYKNNKFGIDMEELVQIGALALINVFDTYDETKGASELTYYYTCVEKYILREFQNLGRAKRFCNHSISLNRPINNDDDTYLDEIIPDRTINIEKTVLDTLIIKDYISEINRVLNGNQRDIILFKIFDDKSDKEIADILEIEITKVSQIYYKAKDKLIRKSNLIRLKFFELERSKLNKWKSTYWNEAIYYETEIENLKRAIRRENKDKTYNFSNCVVNVLFSYGNKKNLDLTV